MYLGHSEQFGTSSVVLEDIPQDPDQVIQYAEENEATYFDGEDNCFVVQFPGRPVELYTESALRRSLK